MQENLIKLFEDPESINRDRGLLDNEVYTWICDCVISNISNSFLIGSTVSVSSEDLVQESADLVFDSMDLGLRVLLVESTVWDW